MKTAKFNLETNVIIGLMMIVCLTRLFPIFPNFSPTTAICLFGAAFLKKKWQTAIISLLLIFFSDVLVNNILYKSYFSEFTLIYEGMIWNYLSYFAIIVLGWFALKKINFTNVLATGLLSSILFFIISNLGVWISGTLYTKDLQGLITCYTMAIPFFKGTILSSLIFSMVFIYGFELFRKNYLTKNVIQDDVK